VVRPFRMMLVCVVAAVTAISPADAQVVRRIPAKGTDTVTRAAPIRRDTAAPPREPLYVATLTGTIRDAETGAPLRANVIPELGWEYSGRDGRYAIHLSRVGRQVVWVQQRGFLSEQRVVQVTAGETVTLDVSLRRAPPPCCTLQGTWSVRFVLAEPGLLARREPTDSVVNGLLTFADSISDPMSAVLDPVPNVRTEGGLFDVDFTPFFGGFLLPEQEAWRSPNGYPLGRTVRAELFHGDSVSISLILGMSHGGVVMWGRIAGDVVRGTWFQKAYARGASGTFEMRRVDPGRD
jgi:hypothetical protein